MLDVNEIRKDFPVISNNPGLYYFDSSATAFKPECVIDAVDYFYRNSTSNIHRGDYDISFSVSKEYDSTRKTVKEFINASNEREIVFTSGASASLNLVAYSYGLSKLNEGDVILTSEVEHASNILPWFKVAEQTKAQIRYIPFNSDGTFNMDEYTRCLDSSVKIVAITAVSNVLGYIYPVKEIVRLAHENGAVVVVDGSQSVPHIKTDVQDLDCDFLAFSAHKMCGPSGVGVLYGKLNLLNEMDPLFYGGGSNARFNSCGEIILKETPFKFESGTPNIEGVIGFNAALKYLLKLGMDNIHEYDKHLAEYFVNELKKLDNVEIYNPNTDCGIVSFNVKGVFAQDAAGYFNRKGIAVRTGNHCAKILHEIIGVNESIRASMFFYNTIEEIDYFIGVIKETTLEKCIEVFI